MISIKFNNWYSPTKSTYMTVVKTKTRKSFGLVDLLKLYIWLSNFWSRVLFNTHSAYDTMSFVIEWLDHADVGCYFS